MARILSRRHFLRRSAVASAFVALPVRAQTAVPGRTVQPVILATWNNRKATRAAWEVLSAGASSLDAVEAAARVPEADPDDRSVGLGGRPDRDGRVTLDACIMDHAGHCGSVAALEHILHPVSVARRVMERTPHVMLVGEGALRFAIDEGFEQVELLTPASEAEWRAWLETAEYRPVVNIERHDTIGVLGLGTEGDLAGACTTSGAAYKMHGRVGDSPIIGAGLFVDGEVGAATATGLGEEVLRMCGSHLVVERMRQGVEPEVACREAVERIVRRTPSDLGDVQVGFLALRHDGAFGAFSVRPGFNFTVYRPDLPNVVLESSAFLR